VAKALGSKQAPPDPAAGRHADGGEEVIPDTRGPESVDLPKLAPHPKFFLGEHPRRWKYYPERKRILPDLSRIAHDRGVNLVGEDGDTTDLEKRYRREGWTLLEPGIVARSPGGGKSYMKRVKVEEGVAYITRWERVLPGSATVIPDPEGYFGFLEWLVDSGAVRLPPVHVMSAAADEARATGSRYARTGDRDPEARRRAELWADTEAAWREAIERATASAPDTGEEVDPEDEKPAPKKQKAAS
jgi:hypothetical protein